MDPDWTRVPEGHPDKCETQGCLILRMKGSRFCAAHGGNKGAEAAAKESLKNYRLGKWKFQKQVAEKAGSSELKSLTEEIAILRQIIQEHLMACEDETDLILKSGPISDLITKVNTLVMNCNNIDKSLGNLIDKEKVVLFAKVVVDIITPHIPKEKLDELNLKIQESIRLL